MPTNQFNGEVNANAKIVDIIKNSLDKKKHEMFKVMTMSNVNGQHAHQLYKYIRQVATETHIEKHENGKQIICVDGDFAMFLVDKDGKKAQYISSKANPEAVKRIIHSKVTIAYYNNKK